MKVSRISLKNFRQFKDLELDLTYPGGHDKAGEPLDKVCIIGQSGVGKTSIIEFIKACSESASEDYLGLRDALNGLNKENLQIKFEYEGNSFIAYVQNDDLTCDPGPTFGDSDKKDYCEVFWNHLQSHSRSLGNFLYYFPAEFIPERALPKVDKSLIEEVSGEYFVNSNNEVSGHFTFNDQRLSKLIWSQLETEIRDYTNEKSKFIFAIARAVQKKDLKEQTRQSALLEKWEMKNPNPLSELANNYLDPILESFHLKTKTELENLNETEFIQLINKRGNTVPPSFWSTGTKNIIYKTLPLYTLWPKDSIILIDEPESSLYPDIQTQIVNLYTRLGENCQFIFATHSPLIASNFEPWEIIELKFDSEGFIYQDLYYDLAKGRHVDNYKLFPQYLRWDSILMKVFDLPEEGNSAFREQELTKAVGLKKKLEKMKAEGQIETETYKEKLDEYTASATKLGWEL